MCIGAGSGSGGSGLQVVIWEINLDIVQGNTCGPAEEQDVACHTVAMYSI